MINVTGSSIGSETYGEGDAGAVVIEADDLLTMSGAQITSATYGVGNAGGIALYSELIDITAPGGTEYSWEQLPDAIKALEDGEDINYTGASGALDMDVHGNPTNGVYDMYEYTAGGALVFNY